MKNVHSKLRCWTLSRSRSVSVNSLFVVIDEINFCFSNFFLEAELLWLELLHSDKVPKHASDESQQGGAVSTRSRKKNLESEKVDLKPLKDEPRTVKRKLEEDVDMSDLMDDGMDEFLV